MISEASCQMLHFRGNLGKTKVGTSPDERIRLNLEKSMPSTFCLTF